MTRGLGMARLTVVSSDTPGRGASPRERALAASVAKGRGRCQQGWSAMGRCPTPPVSCPQCEPARQDGQPRITQVSSGAINVGRPHVPESMMMGRAGDSIAGRPLNECEPQHLLAIEGMAL